MPTWLRGVCLTALVWLSISGGLELWHMLVFAGVHGAASAFFLPAFEALVPQLVAEDRLAEANALDQFVRPAMLWLIGPAVGGVLIGTAGPAAGPSPWTRRRSRCRRAACCG